MALRLIDRELVAAQGDAKRIADLQAQQARVQDRLAEALKIRNARAMLSQDVLATGDHVRVADSGTIAHGTMQ